MAYGAIKKIREDEAGKTFSGKLIDLETKNELDFNNQPGLDNVNRYDVVTFTVLKQEAVNLVPNISVRLVNFDTAAPDVQTSVQDLLLKMARDKNLTDVVCRKI